LRFDDFAVFAPSGPESGPAFEESSGSVEKTTSVSQETTAANTEAIVSIGIIGGDSVVPELEFSQPVFFAPTEMPVSTGSNTELPATTESEFKPHPNVIPEFSAAPKNVKQHRESFVEQVKIQTESPETIESESEVIEPIGSGSFQPEAFLAPVTSELPMFVPTTGISRNEEITTEQVEIIESGSTIEPVVQFQPQAFLAPVEQEFLPVSEQVEVTVVESSGDLSGSGNIEKISHSAPVSEIISGENSSSENSLDEIASGEIASGEIASGEIGSSFEEPMFAPSFEEMLGGNINNINNFGQNLDLSTMNRGHKFNRFTPGRA